MPTSHYEWNGHGFELPSRDVFRSRVYSAERNVWSGDPFPSLGPKRTVAFVRGVEKSQTWKTLLDWSSLPETELDISLPEKNLKWARGGRGLSGGFLILPPWSRSKQVILHEMAHSATPGVGHHWPWAVAFLMLLGRFVGADSRKRLEESFWSCGVPFSVPQAQPVVDR